MTYPKRNFLFLNVGHLLDHFFMLIFTTAVLTMESEFADSYGRLLLLTTWSFFFFGGASLPAGWLGDKWSKPGMMLVFFFGIGTASILTGFSESPLHVEIGLALVGVFAAIYHPVGLAMVVSDGPRGSCTRDQRGMGEYGRCACSFGDRGYRRIIWMARGVYSAGRHIDCDRGALCLSPDGRKPRRHKRSEEKGDGCHSGCRSKTGIPVFDYSPTFRWLNFQRDNDFAAENYGRAVELFI